MNKSAEMWEHVMCPRQGNEEWWCGEEGMRVPNNQGHWKLFLKPLSLLASPVEYGRAAFTSGFNNQ